MQRNKNIILWAIAGLLLVAISGLAVYKVHPLLFPEILITAALDPDCDLRAGPCTSRLPDGASVTLSIEPRSLPVIKPLAFQVAVTGVTAKAVEIDFSGVDMNMGFNRPALAPSGEGQFSGNGMLPVCVRDAMEWEAKVLIHTDAGLVAAPYRFITVKPGVELP